jgi:hypothetical protein
MVYFLAVGRAKILLLSSKQRILAPSSVRKRRRAAALKGGSVSRLSRRGIAKIIPAAAPVGLRSGGQASTSHSSDMKTSEAFRRNLRRLAPHQHAREVNSCVLPNI